MALQKREEALSHPIAVKRSRAQQEEPFTLETGTQRAHPCLERKGGYVCLETTQNAVPKLRGVRFQ